MHRPKTAFPAWRVSAVWARQRSSGSGSRSRNSRMAGSISGCAPGRRTKNRLRHARPLGPGPGNAKTPDHTLKAQLQLATAETALGLAQPHPQTPLVGLQVPLPDLPHEITALCPPPSLFHLACRPSESRLRLAVQGSRLLGKTPGRGAVPAGDRPIQIPLDLLALDREGTRIDPLQ